MNSANKLNPKPITPIIITDNIVSVLFLPNFPQITIFKINNIAEITKPVLTQLFINSPCNLKPANLFF